MALGITLFLTGCSNGLAGCQSRDTTAPGQAGQQTASPSLESSPTHGNETPDNNTGEGGGSNPGEGGGSNPGEGGGSNPGEGGGSN
ncbi:hypothetical protein ACFYE2_15620, partial [Kocuria sp. CPCC 205300]|uniref:hypothetical protein n=1 Tax=Kocuria sabuli TaxID=3071448 RepID=UPI0036DC58BD